MFVSFLLPYIDRGYGPLFHWVMLRQLASMGPEQVGFIADERYFCRPAPWGEEMEMLGYGFRCPTEASFRAARKAAIPWGVFDELDRRSSSMLDAYRTLLTEVYPPLREAIVKILRDWQSQMPIEAVLTWCNMPSLSRAAAEVGVPVIHNELGPLRPPHYQPTVYFDFQGVNGQTSAAETMQRFARQVRGRYAPISFEQLRRLFSRTAASNKPTENPSYPVGVALQVEDDSNLLAFANGRTNFDLIYAARKRRSAKDVLIRSHPHGHMTYGPKLGVADESPDSGTFISKCAQVWTINSSVAFECLLQEKPVRILGDSPASAFSVEQAQFTDPETRALWLNYLFLGYLVPGRFLFDPEYYRWRLSGPPLEAICQKHLRAFEEDSGTTVGLAEALSAPAAPLSPSTPAWLVPARHCLLDQLALARRVQGQPEQAALWNAEIGGEISRVLYLQPHAQLLFEIPTGANGFFSTAIALHPEVWEKPNSGACEFHLRIDGRLALVLVIDPIHNPSDRRWHSLEVPVPENREGVHHILLETRAAGVGSDFRWALWKEPTFVWQAPVETSSGPNPATVEASAISNPSETSRPERMRL